MFVATIVSVTVFERAKERLSGQDMREHKFANFQIPFCRETIFHCRTATFTAIVVRRVMAIMMKMKWGRTKAKLTVGLASTKTSPLPPPLYTLTLLLPLQQKV
jgi:hypothetical protein